MNSAMQGAGSGYSLRLKVRVQRVDEKEQANVLRRLRCDEMQSFLFSPPLPAAEMEAKLLTAALLALLAAP